MAKKTTTPYAEILGRLKSIGIQEPWQATFMLPSGYDDLREVHTDFNTAHIESEEWGVFRGRLYTLDFRGDGVPRLVGRIEDHHGTQVGFIVFGDTKALQEHLKEFPDDVILYGQGNYLDGRLWLKSVEIINPAWIGHIRPRYNGKKRVITPTTARTRIMACLKQGGISTAVQWLVKTLQMSANELLTFSRTDAESLEILGIRIFRWTEPTGLLAPQFHSPDFSVDIRRYLENQMPELQVVSADLAQAAQGVFNNLNMHLDICGCAATATTSVVCIEISGNSIEIT